jgi:hypothetical protein
LTLKRLAQPLSAKAHFQVARSRTPAFTCKTPRPLSAKTKLISGAIHRRTSVAKRDFYAHVGVPEIWHYDGKRLQILQWTSSGYTEISHSPTFPVLTARRLTQTLEQSRTKGQSVALRTFRQWLRKNLPAND